MADCTYCGQCIHLESNNKSKYSSKDLYWCNDVRKYVSQSDRSCRYFIMDEAKNTNKPPCYITTMVVDILGYEDNCEVLCTLREFREKTLKTNIEYLPLLFEYDIVGPVICEYLKKEKNNNILCLGLLQHFLIPCVSAIKNDNIEEAISIYKNMVMHLRDTYNLPVFEVKIPESYDLETLGKGRVRSLKTSEI